MIDELFKRGANVIYKSIAEVHVSGHACEEELKLMQAIVKPKYFMPVHGEFRHLTRHKNIAVRMGMPEENVFIMDNGRVLEFNGDEDVYKRQASGSAASESSARISAMRSAEASAL